MLLTVSKRLEFSASRRLFDPRRSAAENIAAFGAESAARYGTGRNYVGYFVFSGDVDPETGMLMNISEMKLRVGRILHERFDHKFLNEDHPAFAETLPTAEAIARQLFVEAEPSFRDSRARLVACHLCETRARSATVYAGGACDSNHWIEFSAARQTMSPHLSTAENERLFGRAASPHGHGHHYRARLTFDGSTTFADRDLQSCLQAVRENVDHKNLNHEVPGLVGRPITTESLAQWIHEEAAGCLPVQRVRLHERDDFFAEHWNDGRDFLGMRHAFSAAHRLYAPKLSEERNTELYGKCNNPRGHGHSYVAEATIAGRYDKRSGTLASFDKFRVGLADALRPWHDRHLDLETPEFADKPSTGENIVQVLWPKVDATLGESLVRLRLWETANNRFTLRR